MEENDAEQRLQSLLGKYIRVKVTRPMGVALRGLFLIDKEGIVRHETINDLPLGRCVKEAMRMVQALKFYEEHGEVCPANWQRGMDTMKPTPSGAMEYFEKTYGEKRL